MESKGIDLEDCILTGDIQRLRETAPLSQTALWDQVLDKCGSVVDNARQLECIEALLQLGASPQSWMLALSVKLQAHSTTQFLLSHGCDPNLTLSSGQNALLSCLLSGDTVSAESLIQHRADTTVRDEAGNSPLHLAAQAGYFSTVQLLITHKADLMSRNNHGDTPLHVAIHAGYREIAVRLIAAGSSLTAENKAGLTPLAQGNGRLAGELRKEYGQRYRPKYNGNTKPSRWREVHKPVPAPDDTEIRQLRLELAQALEAKTQAEHQYKALQYILEQRSLEVQKLRSKSDASFLHLSDRPQPVEKLLQTLHCDIQRYEEEVDAWQAKVAPVLEELVTRVRFVTKELWPEAEVTVYGSFPQKLHLPTSDLDLVITGLTHESVSVLSQLESTLRKQPYVSTTTLISTAYIPLLKVQSNCAHSVMIDISIAQSQHSGKNCTALVQTYLRRYTVLRPVLLVLKQVLYALQFHEPFKGGLGSYGLTLMTVFVLQQPGLPREISIDPSHALLEFLRFYSNYGFLFPINPSDELTPLDPETATEVPYLVIQDPLSPENNVGRNTSLHHFQDIVKTCYKALVRAGAGTSALVQMVNVARLVLSKSE